MAAVKNGREYLSHVTETLRHRIAQLDDSIEAGQKEIEGMHEYYWGKLYRDGPVWIREF